MSLGWFKFIPILTKMTPSRGRWCNWISALRRTTMCLIFLVHLHSSYIFRFSELCDVLLCLKRYEHLRKGKLYHSHFLPRVQNSKDCHHQVALTPIFFKLSFNLLNHLSNEFISWRNKLLVGYSLPEMMCGWLECLQNRADFLHLFSIISRWATLITWFLILESWKHLFEFDCTTQHLIRWVLGFGIGFLPCLLVPLHWDSQHIFDSLQQHLELVLTWCPWRYSCLHQLSA